MPVSQTTPHPGSGAETDRAASQAVDNLTAYITNYMDTRKPTTVRGVVTAVTRDATGINEVSIQRTGQAAADRTPYVVYAQGFVPIVGDRITLQKLGSSWLVVGADHGGRPNEHTVAYAGGSHRKYDSGRALQHKHGDDHHARHYNTDGATITHHAHAGGDHKHVGVLVHNAASIADDGTPTGGHQHAHLNSQYEHAYSGQRLRSHHAAAGEAVYQTDGGTVTHHRHPAGDLKHVGNYYLAVGGLSSTGAPGGVYHRVYHDTTSGQWRQYINANDTKGERLLHAKSLSAHSHFVDNGAGTGTMLAHTLDLLGHTHPNLNKVAHDNALNALYAYHGPKGYRVWDHDATTHQHYVGGVVTIKLSSSGATFGGTSNGGTLSAKQHASSSAHTLGDDGAGLIHLGHATAGKVYDHNGALMRHFVGGNPALTHDGTTHQHYAGGAVTLKLTTTGTVFNNTTNGGVLTTKQHGAAGAHLFGDDGAGLAHIAHATAGKVYDHSGTLMRHFVGGNAALTHDGTTLTHLRSGVTTTQLTTAGAVYGTGADGGILSCRVSGSATSKHQVGDDGGGNLHARHGGGNLALTHSGSAISLYAGSTGAVALSHDGTTHKVYIPGATYPGVTHAAAGVGATMTVRSAGNTAATHQVGDDATGNLQAYSQGNHLIRVGAGVAAHQHNTTSHIFPPNSRVNSYSDRLDLLEQSNTYGAIKRNSHSLYIVYDTQPCTLPTGGGGHGVTHGSTDSYDTPHFKLTEHNVWYGTNGGGYRHSSPTPTANNGYGSGVNGGTATAYWNQVETYGDNSTAIYGITTSAAAFSGNSTQKYIGVNA